MAQPKFVSNFLGYVGSVEELKRVEARRLEFSNVIETIYKRIEATAFMQHGGCDLVASPIGLLVTVKQHPGIELPTIALALKTYTEESQTKKTERGLAVIGVDGGNLMYTGAVYGQCLMIPYTDERLQEKYLYYGIASANTEQRDLLKEANGLFIPDDIDFSEMLLRIEQAYTQNGTPTDLLEQLNSLQICIDTSLPIQI